MFGKSMGVRVEVEWTEQAMADLEEIHSYLLQNWSKKEAESFLNKAKEFQDIVSSFPNASIKSPKRK